MEVEHLIARYPKLYHMAEEGSWDRIREHGLLSTTALLDLFGIEGQERYAIESQWRRSPCIIEHPQYGKAVIRDQTPMPPSMLEKALQGGISVQEWYELLNGKTFFWAAQKRLIGFLSAQSHKPRPHDVITVDTRDLLVRHSEKITLSHINSGTVRHIKHKRGPYTFQSIEGFPSTGREACLVEVAVQCAVPDIASVAVKVERWQRNNLLQTIWER